MTTKRNFCYFCLRLAFFSLVWLAGQDAEAVVGVTVTPSAVSNTFNGTVTLQVTGLTTGDTVVVQKYLDANANGIIDAADLLAQQFTLTDGKAGMMIGGITNINVPGDTDTVSGQITAKLILNENDFIQLIIGNYLFKISSPTGHFTALTNVFAVTNFPFGQGFTGSVVSNGTATTVANAAILLFPPPRPGHHDLGQPLAGGVANNSGAFSIQVPVGTYRLFAFKSNYVIDTSVLPMITSIGGAAVHTNLSLLGATANISGRMVDSTNSSLGLPGVLVTAGNDSGLVGIGGSDTNGNFIANVQSGDWQLGALSGALLLQGYVDPNNGAATNAGATGVAVEFTKASALFYGSVKDTLGNPAPGVDVNGEDNNNSLYDIDVYTDQNGNYAMGAVGGLGSSDEWTLNVGGDGVTNYDFSQPSFDLSGGTNIGIGEAALANFTALASPYTITGNVKAGGTNIAGAGIFANATINNATFNIYQDTDANGNFSFNVGPGNWSINVNCNGGSDSLDGILGSGNYICPSGANLDITTSDETANFTVQFQTFDAYVSGKVVDNHGNPVGNMNLFAFVNGGGSAFGATTDGSGNYRMGVDAGSYDVQLNTDPNTGAPSLGLVSPTLPITVTTGVNINNLGLVAQQVTGSIHGSITNSSNHGGVAGIYLSANATVNGTNYTTGSQLTDGSGLVTLGACNGNWNVFADCNGLSGAGFTCPNNLDVIIANDSGVANFLVSGGAAPSPSLDGANWTPGHFQMTLNGEPNQNYTVQFSTTLTNWAQLFVTNGGPSGSFNVTDKTATNGHKYYRILVGP